MHSYLLTYLLLLTYPLTYSLTYSLAYSLTRWLTHLLTHLPTHLLTRLLADLLTHSLTQWLTHLLTLSYSLTPSYSLTHSLTLTHSLLLTLLTLLLVSLALFAFTKKGVVLEEKHPFFLTVLGSCLWWLISTALSVFVKGLFQSLNIFNNMHNFAYFSDENVSIHTSESLFYPFITIFLGILTVPALYIPMVMKRQEYSVDMLFMLSVISAIAIVGASINR